MSSPTPLAIVGWEEGHAGQIHSWIEELLNVVVVAFIHDEDEMPAPDRATVMHGRAASQFDFPQGGRFKGVHMLAAHDWPAHVWASGVRHVLVTNGDERQRLANITAARAAGLELVNALHPSAIVLADAIIGENVIAHAGAIIGYRAEIGDGVIFNTGAQADHHTVLHACCTLDPGVLCAGGVVIESFAHLNPGAIVAKRVRIGEGAIVAAGAVVMNDVAPGVRVMGTPARPK